MNTGIVTTFLALAACLTLFGCATPVVDDLPESANAPMISASEFEAMITVEVTMVEPTPADEAILAATN